MIPPSRRSRPTARIPSSGTEVFLAVVDLYYDVWYCVPSRLALRIAMKQIHSPDELAEYLALSERVLVEPSTCADFKKQLSDADDVEEVVFWLKRKAGR